MSPVALLPDEIDRRDEKAVIFGQQTRLRSGILMKEDERLSRFHAVKYMDGGMWMGA